jgi:hypothetical protein
MFFRAVLLSLAALCLAGCATVPPPSIGLSDFQKYRIADVAVEGVDVIHSWPAEEEAFLKSSVADPEIANRLQSEPASNFPAVRAHFQRALEGRLRAEFASTVAPIFTGPRPLRAVVRLKAFDVPSTARRVFVDNQAKLQADIELIDPASKSVILRYHGPYWRRALVGGLATDLALAIDRSDVGSSQITDYMTAYRSWLLQN